MQSNMRSHSSPRRVLVVLPAFNEEAKLGVLLDRIEEELSDAGLTYTVIVVDDGSTDATADVVRTRSTFLPVILHQHDRNQGLGATIRDGLAAAVEMAVDGDIIVTMDADDTHTPGLVLRMVRMIREGHDVVIASRYQPGARVIGLSPGRRLLSYGASLLFRVLFPTPGIRDFTCGYRAYRAEVLREAIKRYGPRFVDQEGFQCMVDILLKLRRQPIVFGEVPFILRYDYKVGATKMKVVRTTANTLRLLARRRFGSGL